jgi:aminocarboxymuconate-semialdehyde decarboxylase
MALTGTTGSTPTPDATPGEQASRWQPHCPQCAIDIHAHWFPRRWLAELERRGPAHGLVWEDVPGAGPRFRHGHLSTGPAGPRFVDLVARSEAMAEQGVSMQVLSLSQPMVYWAGRDDGHALATVYNDCLAEAHQSDPQRFVGLATLPLQAIDLALREIERLPTLPGIRGVCIATCVLDKDLSDPAFFPVYERLEALGLPVFLHPTFVLAAERLEKFYLTNLLGNPFETAVAAAHLIFGGVLDRFPRLEFVLPHAGGAYPWLAGRLRRGWEKRPDLLKATSRSPEDYLRRFHYDTIGYSPVVLEHLVAQVGAERVLMGSDYCFPIAYERPVEIVTDLASLSPAAQAAILEGNARRLLGLPNSPAAT